MSRIIYALSIIFTSIILFSCSQENKPTTPPPQPNTVEPTPVKAVIESSALKKSETTLHRITSKILGYDLQYWVHLPVGYTTDIKYPTLYVTDGIWYIEEGELPELTDQMIEEKEIWPIITIYVDAYDPDNSDKNRRNKQFLCNPDYVKFYREELIPEIDANYSTDTDPLSTGILGLSFGGLNSMYFGLHASDVFGKVAIQSPAPHPCPDIYDDYKKQPLLPIDIYLSTGTVNDKKRATLKFKNILDKKGYKVKYQEVAEGHNWRNWRPLLDDVLIWFNGA